jgi:hypothetical protein
VMGLPLLTRASAAAMVSTPTINQWTR